MRAVGARGLVLVCALLVLARRQCRGLGLAGAQREEPAGGEAADPTEQYGAVPVTAPVNVGTTLLKMSPEQVAMASMPWEGTDTGGPRGFPRQDPWDTPGDSTDHTPFAHKNLLPPRPPPYIPGDVDWGKRERAQQLQRAKEDAAMQTHWAREVHVPSLPAMGPALYGKDVKPEGYYINPLKPDGGLLGQLGVSRRRRLRFLELSSAVSGRRHAPTSAPDLAPPLPPLPPRPPLFRGANRVAGSVAHRNYLRRRMNHRRRAGGMGVVQDNAGALRGSPMLFVQMQARQAQRRSQGSSRSAGGTYPVNGGSSIGQGLPEGTSAGYSGLAPRAPPGTFASSFANPLRAGPQYENSVEAANALAAAGAQVWPPWQTQMGTERMQKAIKYVREGTPVVIENPDGIGNRGGGRLLPPVQNVKNEMLGVLPGLPGNPSFPGT